MTVKTDQDICAICGDSGTIKDGERCPSCEGYSSSNTGLYGRRNEPVCLICRGSEALGEGWCFCHVDTNIIHPEENDSRLIIVDGSCL